MAFLSSLIFLLIVAAVVLAWWLTRRLTGAAGPTEDQKRAVAENFLKGAQLMGRTSDPGKSTKGRPKPASGPDGVSIDPETDDAPPRENLRAALAAFNTGLRSNRYDFSTRYLKAQALEDLGELNDALKELDWLISAKSAVKHGFFRRMAIALGLLEYRTIAPMGTTLKGDCDQVDLIVFHLRKRRGRVLLKKRRADEAIPELNAALKMLDQMAWKDEMNERGRIVRERMKTLKGQDIGKPGSATSSFSGAAPAAKTGPGEEEGEKLLQSQDSGKLGGLGSLQRDSKGSQSQKSGSGTFQATFARAELSLLLGRCYEIQGSTTKALRWFHEAESLGETKVREEAKIALKQMVENAQNGTKTE